MWKKRDERGAAHTIMVVASILVFGLVAAGLSSVLQQSFVQAQYQRVNTALANALEDEVNAVAQLGFTAVSALALDGTSHKVTVAGNEVTATWGTSSQGNSSGETISLSAPRFTKDGFASATPCAPGVQSCVSVTASVPRTLGETSAIMEPLINVGGESSPPAVETPVRIAGSAGSDVAVLDVHRNVLTTRATTNSGNWTFNSTSIDTSKKFVEIAAWGYNFAALDTNGKLYTWFKSFAHQAVSDFSLGTNAPGGGITFPGSTTQPVDGGTYTSLHIYGGTLVLVDTAGDLWYVEAGVYNGANVRVATLTKIDAPVKFTSVQTALRSTPSTPYEVPNIYALDVSGKPYVIGLPDDSGIRHGATPMPVPAAVTFTTLSSVTGAGVNYDSDKRTYSRISPLLAIDTNGDIWGFGDVLPGFTVTGGNYLLKSNEWVYPEFTKVFDGGDMVSVSGFRQNNATYLLATDEDGKLWFTTSRKVANNYMRIPAATTLGEFSKIDEPSLVDNENNLYGKVSSAGNALFFTDAQNAVWAWGTSSAANPPNPIVPTVAVLGDPDAASSSVYAALTEPVKAGQMYQATFQTSQPITDVGMVCTVGDKQTFTAGQVTWRSGNAAVARVFAASCAGTLQVTAVLASELTGTNVGNVFPLVEVK